MLISSIAGSLALFVGYVTAQANAFPASLTTRQLAIPPMNDCNSTCSNFQKMRSNCKTPHCGCNVSFVQAQGGCLVCQASTPQDAAAVQFLLDSEITECQSAGFDVQQFQLDLPPAAAAIVHKFHSDSASLRRYQTAFLALQISGGHVALVIVLASAVFSRHVRRDLTFLNFCITWIFSSIFFSISLYRGNKGNNTASPLGVVPPNQCRAQAALTEGAQVMTACSTLAVVVQLWLSLRTAISPEPIGGPKKTKWMTFALIATPYLLFICFALPPRFISENQLVINGIPIQSVIPLNFYCTVIPVNHFLRAVYSVTLGLLLITVGVDVLIISILYRQWRAFRHAETGGTVSLSFVIRAIAFSVYHVVVAIAYETVIVKPPIVTGQGVSLDIFFDIPIWVDILQAAIPLIVFFVIGINRDMIDSFMFWRKSRAAKTATATDISLGRFSAMSMDRRPSRAYSTASSTMTEYRSLEQKPSSFRPLMEPFDD